MGFQFSLKSSISFGNKQFRQLTERWRFCVRDVSRNQGTTKLELFHVVKMRRCRGENLTLISKQYGVSMDKRSAANKRRVDFDLANERHHLDIRSTVLGDPWLESRTNPLPDLGPEEQRGETVGSSDNLPRQTIVSSLNWHSLPQVKTRGYFLLLVPLVAFCIGCVTGAFHKRVGRDTEHPSAKKSKRSRWKSVLLAEVKDPDSIPCHKVTREDEDQDSSEEVCHQAYSKLKRDYQHFLSECGMSEYGYWRGGLSQ